MGHKVINLFARILLGGLFLGMGVDIVFRWSSMHELAKKQIEMILTHETGWMTFLYKIGDSILPIWLAISLAIFLISGLFLIVGFKQRLMSIMLFFLTFLFGLFYHPFWLFDEKDRMEQMLDVWLYLGLLSALLYCFSTTFEKKPQKQESPLQH
jgi:uncharacterized membrane protein YphA (DoxX/SURF4 family)